jgi:eukaryotic-like serine/threonine-protein kinase
MSTPPNREVALFSAALELPASERAAYLAAACADDPALRLRLEALLRVHEEAIPFLETPPPGAQDSPMGAGGPGATIRVAFAPSEKAGDRIGRYKLLQQIGEGGCGVVYMAEQEEPVRRRVALKVIKLGMDTKQVVARFEAERQALALMDHPNIAKVFDAGATEAGRPFFVMELVRGIKITDFCDENKVSTEDRLKLFIQVCQAIQHAHQKGIIHRDIKPSNILVADHDGVAVPKIIDFGIAKATTDQRLTDKTLFTAFEQFMGTPAYMSPEQAKLSGLDIDTRSDIYSLGVLLYELLTGLTPFDSKALMQAGLDEIRRTIREQEPARPSTRLSTMAAADLTEVADRRRAEPAKLSGLIRGDLDWIVMKALEKDRARRYETANGLATDIQRHLNCEPVVARPPSRLYEFQKTVRRHKFGFAAAAALIALLAVGVLASTFEALRATSAERGQSRLRQKAETEAAKSQQVAQFMKDMLKGVGPKVALGRDTKLLHEILDNTAERARRDLRGQPEVAAELLSTIGGTYLQLYDLTKAEAMEREALRLRTSLFGETNAATAASLNGLARVLINRRGAPDLAEAEGMTRQALSIWNKLGGSDSEDAAFSLYLLGSAIFNQGKLTEAETEYRKCLAIRRRLFGNEHKDVASTLDNLGLVLSGQGKRDEAEQAIREALMIQKKLFGEEHPDVSDSLFNLAQVLRLRGKLSEAESVYRDTLAMRRKLMGNDHPGVGPALSHLVSVYREEGKLAEAEAVCREELEFARKLAGSGKPDAAYSLQRLTDILYDQAKWAAAEAPCREAIALFKQLAQADPKRSGYPIDLGHSQWKLADVLAKTGHRDQTEPILREALQVFEQAARNFPAELFLRKEQAFSHRLLGDALIALGRVDEALRPYRAAIDLYAALAADAPQDASYSLEEAYTTGSLAEILDRAGRPVLAADGYRQAIALYEKAITTFPNNEDLKWHLVELLRGQSKLAEAERVLREALAKQRKMVGSEHLEVATSLVGLSYLLRERGKLPEAETTAREALTIRKKLLGKQHSEVAQSLHVLAWNLYLQNKHTEAEALSREELAMSRKLLGNDDPNVAWALRDLTSFLRDQGKLPEAETTIRESLAIRQKRLGSTHRDTVDSFNLLVDLLRSQGKLAEAEQAYREALAAYAKCHALGSDAYAGVVRSLLEVLKEENKPGASETLCREILAQQRAAFINDNLAVAETLSSLAASLYAQGKQAEAEKASREAMEILLNLSDPDRAKLPPGVRQLAEGLKSHGKSQDAEKLFEAAINLTRQKLGETNLILGELLHAYGDFLEDENKFEAAVEYQLKALPIRRAHPDNILWWTMHDLGDELVALRRPQEAEAYYRESLALYRKLHPQEDVGGTAWMCLTLGDALYQQHKLSEAEQAYRDALAVYTKCQALGSEDGERAVRSLLDVLKAENKLAEGEALCREILTQQRAAFTNDNPAVAQTLSRFLGDALNRLGRLGQAEGEPRVAIARDAGLEAAAPTSPFYWQEEAFATWMTAEMLEGAGRLDAAEAEYRHALALYEKASADFPNLAVLTERRGTVKVRLVELLRWRGILREAKSMYRQAAEHGGAPEWNEYAWFLASCRDPNVRDGTNAVAFAEKAVAATNRKDANYLDTLSAAYAEIGQFAKAISIEQEAISVSHSEREKRDLASQLLPYENKSPRRDQPDLAAVTAQLTKALLEEKKFTQAEPMARECLAIREKKLPDDWRTFNARSMLGGSLLGQKKYADAEPLLLSGYEGMKQREGNIPLEGKVRLSDALQRLVQLYQATKRPDQAAEWKQKLAALDKSEK